VYRWSLGGALEALAKSRSSSQPSNLFRSDLHLDVPTLSD
jgi:hypothetical protein